MITDKEKARAILLASAQELMELEFDQMAKFYIDGNHPVAANSAFVFAHVWASISKCSIVPLGSLENELQRELPDDVRDILQRAHDALAVLDARRP